MLGMSGKDSITLSNEVTFVRVRASIGLFARWWGRLDTCFHLKFTNSARTANEDEVLEICRFSSRRGKVY